MSAGTIIPPKSLGGGTPLPSEVARFNTITGPGAPLETIGVDDDYYIQTDAPLDANFIWGPKVGTWPAQADYKTIPSPTVSPIDESLLKTNIFRTDRTRVYKYVSDAGEVMLLQALVETYLRPPFNDQGVINVQSGRSGPFFYFKQIGKLEDAHLTSIYAFGGSWNLAANTAADYPTAVPKWRVATADGSVRVSDLMGFTNLAITRSGNRVVTPMPAGYTSHAFAKGDLVVVFGYGTTLEVAIFSGASVPSGDVATVKAATVAAPDDDPSALIQLRPDLDGIGVFKRDAVTDPWPLEPNGRLLTDAAGPNVYERADGEVAQRDAINVYPSGAINMPAPAVAPSSKYSTGNLAAAGAELVNVRHYVAIGGTWVLVTDRTA